MSRGLSWRKTYRDHGVIKMLESFHRSTDQQDGPVAFEPAFGCVVVGGLAAVASLGGSGIDRVYAEGAAPLLGTILFASVGQEEAAIRAQERSVSRRVRGRPPQSSPFR